MKNFVGAVILTFLTLSSVKAQKLSLADLTNLCSKKNWEDVNLALNAKGWSYYDSEKGSSNKYNTINWSYNKDFYSEKANGWFYLYTYEGLPNKVAYSVFNKESYVLIQNSIASAGFKVIGSEIEDNEIISTYSNSNYTLEIRTEKREDDDSYESNSFTAYNITLIKKSGIYDTENGKKVDYYYDDVVKVEYTLLNGKVEGAFKVYYENGRLKKTGSYSKGKQNGSFKEYSEQGNLISEYAMINDELNGILKEYHTNGKLKKSETYLNGMLNGHLIEHDEEGVILSDFQMANGMKNGVSKRYGDGKVEVSITFKDDIKNGERIEYYYDDETGELELKQIENYLNDKKNGRFQFVVIEKDKSERVLKFENYVQGIKEGPFQEPRGDSLIIGSYKADKLNGPYKVYVDLTSLFLGGVIHTDIKDLKLLEEGNYSEDIKSGYWKMYDLTGALRNEGRYINGLQSGIWKYYYTTCSIPDKGDLPYSRELFSEQTYSNGVLEGRSLRYSYLDEKRLPCSELDPAKNPLDTCKIDIYKRILETSFFKSGKLNGPYEIRDSNDVVMAKGIFKDGLEEGEWLHRYSEKDENEQYYDLLQKGFYSKGKREGNWVQYYSESKARKTFQYVNGELDGEWIDFYELNLLRRKKLFRKGKLYELTTYDSISQRMLCKYEVYDENESYYRCRKTEFFIEGFSESQEYRMPMDYGINADVFELIFDLNLSTRFNGKGYKDGEYKLFDKSGQLLVTGFFYKTVQTGLWTFYYRDKGVKIEQVFSDGNFESEKYYLLNNDLYSGEFTYSDKAKGIREIRKIKNGLRNGKTVIVDAKTNETIRKEIYKDGILKQ